MKTAAILFTLLMLAACGKREEPAATASVSNGRTPVITNQGTIECR